MLSRLATRVARRAFATETQKQAVLTAVRDFMKQRRSEIEHELQFKGENATEEDKTLGRQQIEALAKEVTETSAWKEFGFDGLDEVECVLTIEDALNIRLPDDEFHAIHGVQDALKVVAKYHKPSESSSSSTSH